MAVTVKVATGAGTDTYGFSGGEGWITDGKGGLSIVNADKSEVARFSNYLAVFMGEPS